MTSWRVNSQKSKTDLLLVVNKYNAIDFDILKALGFYNPSDSESEVKDPNNTENHVKPISFESIIGKEYKVFTHEEFYSLSDTDTVADKLGYQREMNFFSSNAIDETFYKNHGTTLRISGIVRTKSTSTLSILSPSLCFSNELQNELVAENEGSDYTESVSGHIAFQPKEETDTMLTFISEFRTLIKDYLASGSSVLPTSQLNQLLNRYFRYYSMDKKGYYYEGFSTFLSQASYHGANLISSDLYGKNLADESVLNELLNKLESDYFQSKNVLNKDRDQYAQYVYDDVISFVAYANAYSSMSALVIFPTNLAARVTLSDALDSFNEIQANSSSHASSVDEVITYATSDLSSFLKEVGDVIDLATIILAMFAVVSFTCSISMTALMTSNNVFQRKKEIALLRALGARKVDISLIFEIESVMMGLVAGFIGALASYLITFPVNYFINVYMGYYKVGALCNFTYYHALIILAVSLFVGAISSLIPALRAAKTKPGEALKGE